MAPPRSALPPDSCPELTLPVRIRTGRGRPHPEDCPLTSLLATSASLRFSWFERLRSSAGASSGEQDRSAIIDLLHDGKPTRRAVAGPRGPLITSDPDSPVIRDVMDTGGPVVLDPIEDEAVFGRTPSGAPILAVAQAGSLVSVGLTRGERIVGALTLIRREDRRGFSLADAAFFAEIGTHIAITFGNRGMLDGILDAPPE